MTVWALNLIKGRKRVDSEIHDTEAELAKIKQMQTHFDKNTKRGKKQFEDYKQKEMYDPFHDHHHSSFLNLLCGDLASDPCLVFVWDMKRTS